MGVPNGAGDPSRTTEAFLALRRRLLALLTFKTLLLSSAQLSCIRERTLAWCCSSTELCRWISESQVGKGVLFPASSNVSFIKVPLSNRSGTVSSNVDGLAFFWGVEEQRY